MHINQESQNFLFSVIIVILFFLFLSCCLFGRNRGMEHMSCQCVGESGSTYWFPMGETVGVCICDATKQNKDGRKCVTGYSSEDC